MTENRQALNGSVFGMLAGFERLSTVLIEENVRKSTLCEETGNE